MKRPTKPFVVEYKRSARKAFGPSTISARDMAASLPTPAADSIPKSPQAAASALFEITGQSSPTSNSVPTEPLVLAVLTVEGDSTPETEQTQDDPLRLHDPSSPAIEARASPRKTKARKQVAVSAPADIGAGPQMAPAGDDGAMAGTCKPRAASLPAVRRRRRLLEGEDCLPRGQRWKRRLPKFMR
ncbi:hypothetical protein KHC23_04215 [Ancylobacter dichloromethanicus]|uniref:hypothetical protein n=1 Tax=Ancylobacter dichloromethanicus TaxID=518825 RepID=UPI001BCDEFA1|nr:hypothetical protein [Ancylobacter dichloromethanicus]MBS7552861.1 hypothetical protein [Ancylobacter dichloromethanicus]